MADGTTPANTVIPVSRTFFGALVVAVGHIIRWRRFRR